MKAQYRNDDGEWVQDDLLINGMDAGMLMQSPFFRAIAKAEWDLIARYDRGELHDIPLDISADDG